MYKDLPNSSFTMGRSGTFPAQGKSLAENRRGILRFTRRVCFCGNNRSSPMQPQNASTSLAASAVPVEVRCLMSDANAGKEHAHSAAELILNFGSTLGAVVWRTSSGDTRTATIDANHCCVIPPGVRHFAKGLSSHGFVSFLVSSVVPAELMRENVTDVIVENFRHVASSDALAGYLVTEFGRLMERQPHAIMLHALGTTLAIKLMHVLSQQGRDRRKKVGGLSFHEQERAREYIAAHLAEHISVSALARHVAMSRTHFTRRFRAAFGVSPLQYALKMRVDKALTLLRTGSYRVAEAADAVGFFDQSHLDRHCRKFYGVPPSSLQRA